MDTGELSHQEETGAFICMQTLQSPVHRVDAVETYGSVHRYIAGPFFWDTGCSSSDAGPDRWADAVSSFVCMS